VETKWYTLTFALICTVEDTLRYPEQQEWTWRGVHGRRYTLWYMCTTPSQPTL